MNEKHLSYQTERPSSPSMVARSSATGDGGVLSHSVTQKSADSIDSTADALHGAPRPLVARRRRQRADRLDRRDSLTRVARDRGEGSLDSAKRQAARSVWQDNVERVRVALAEDDYVPRHVPIAGPDKGVASRARHATVGKEPTILMHTQRHVALGIQGVGRNVASAESKMKISGSVHKTCCASERCIRARGVE
eukprot:281550-Pleurochrysis_carterae.AAC.2